MITMHRKAVAAALGACLGALSATANTWKPAKAVEFVLPSQRASGGDKLMRKIAAIMEEHGNLPHGYTVVNKPERQGAAGFLYLKAKTGDDHTLMQAGAATFFNPVVLNLPITYREFTPVARLVIDDFVLWVNAETPYQTAPRFLKAVRARPTRYQIAGAGTGREDQLVVNLLQDATGTLFSYVAVKGGADSAKALAEKRVDATVSNPGEIVDLFRQGKVRPLAVFSDERIGHAPWRDLPTMKELGFDARYKMMRGVFGPPNMSAEALAFYVGALRRVLDDPEFKEFAKGAALADGWLTGKDFRDYLEEQNEQAVKFLEKMSHE